MRITPIAKTFAAEIEDIDLHSPLDAGAAAATPSSPTCAPPMTRRPRPFRWLSWCRRWRHFRLPAHPSRAERPPALTANSVN
jgi:hypothetical protein